MMKPCEKCLELDKNDEFDKAIIYLVDRGELVLSCVKLETKQ